MEYKDRIVGLRRVRASDLVRNPKNWRRHPPQQKQALRGILSEIGFADAVIARELPDGRLELIDGHMRADEALDQEIPVLVVDLNDDEAQKLLAVLDSITGLAETDPDALGTLLATIEADDAELRHMLAVLGEMVDKLENKQRAKEDKEQPVKPEMELLPHEHYDYVIVLARTTRQWNRLADLLGFETRKIGSRKFGIGRGIEASRLIALLEGARSSSHGNASDCSAESEKGGEHEADSNAPPDGTDLRE